MSNIKVPFLDLSRTYSELKPELDQAYFDVMTGGHYIMGRQLSQFEERFAHYTGIKKCVGVSNGLDALHLSLKALGIKAGDEIIVPSNTFIATWLAVTYVGAVPVSVAPEANGFNIDPSKVKAAITSKTKAIIPVHLYGEPCEMDEILKIAWQDGLHVLEDAAQAQGATFGKKKCGSFGTVNSFSFYPGKNLGAFGDAGAITTDDENIYDKLLYYRNYGSRVKYQHDYIGHNYRLDEMQAAFLSVKLNKLDSWNSLRQKIAADYNKGIHNPHVVTPKIFGNRHSVWHLYVIKSKQRDRLQKYLADLGIQTLVHYPIPPAAQRAYKNQPFVEIEKYTEGDQLLSLPIDPFLTPEQVNHVIHAINQFKV